MVHVEKIKVKGNIYYKLVHNIRVNGKVKSKSKYVGKELPPSAALTVLKKQFYDEITAQRKLHTKSASAMLGTHTPKQGQTVRLGPSFDLKFYQSLFANSLNSIFIVDVTTKKILDFNFSAQILTGYSESELLQRNFLDLLVKAKETTTMIADFALGRRKDLVEMTFVSKFQQTIPTLGTIFTVHTNDGDVLVCTFKNITVLKKTEKDLAMVYEAIKTSIDGIVIFDHAEKVIYVNKAFLEVMGIFNENIIGIHLRQFLPLEKIQGMVAKITHTKKTIKLKLVRRDGTEFIGALSSTSITNQEHETVGGMISLIDITLQEQAQIEINVERKRYMDLVESLPQLIYRARVDTLEVTYMNSSAKSILGLDKKWDGNSNLLNDSIYVQDKEKVLTTIENARKNKTSVDFVHRILRQDQKIIWVLHTISWNSDEKGQCVAMVGSISDINESKEAEDKYHQLFDFSPAAMLEVDFSAVKQELTTLQLTTEDGIRSYFDTRPLELLKLVVMVKVVNVNKAALSLFQADHEEAFRIAYLKNFCRDSNEVFIDEIVAIVTGKKFFEKEINIFSLDGKRHQIILQWSVPYAYSDSYGKVLKVLIDTTIQRVLAENMRIKNYAIQSSKTALVLTALDGVITYANYAFFDFCGDKKPDSVIGKNIMMFIPEKGAIALNRIHAQKSWIDMLAIQHSVRDTRYYDAEGAFVVDDFNEPLGLVFSFIDVTERSQTEQIRLEFTNIVTHELKTPLTPLQTFLTMLDESPNDYGINEKGSEYIDVCLRNVRRLNELIGDILDISRLEAGGMKFEMEELDLLDLLREQVEEYSIIAKRKNIILQEKFPNSLPFIYGDKNRLTQIIGGLIKNSLKFTDRGRIVIQAQIKEAHIHVSITDTGIGIRKDDINKLFTKYFQGQDISTRKTKGSGLGLVIAKKIVEAHHGDIWAFSLGEGKGSTFTFTLPIHNKDVQKKGKKVEIKAILPTNPKEIKGSASTAL